jgi:hypothetical protein
VITLSAVIRSAALERASIQMVSLRDSGMTQPVIAEAMGVSLIHDLKVAYEKAIGHETSKSTVYNLLARHGWRQLMRRPFIPNAKTRLKTSLKKISPML